MKNKVTITFASETDAAQFLGAIEHERTHGQSALFRSIAGSAVQRATGIGCAMSYTEAKAIRLGQMPAMMPTTVKLNEWPIV